MNQTGIRIILFSTVQIWGLRNKNVFFDILISGSGFVDPLISEDLGSQNFSYFTEL